MELRVWRWFQCSFYNKVIAQLAERLAQSAALNPDMEVQLHADEAVPYGRIVEVMGVAQKAGLNRIGEWFKM